MLLLAYMMVLHFVADFILQSREMGQKKSVEFKWLVHHLWIQYMIFLAGLFMFFSVAAMFSASWYFFALTPTQIISLASKFALYNAVIHGIIDWNIWKFYKLSAHKRIIKQIREAYKVKFGEDTAVDDKTLIVVTAPEMYQEKVKNWQYWEDHLFYTTIGFDQMLHALTIIALFFILL